MNTPYGDDAVDDSSYNRPDDDLDDDDEGVEHCHHGVSHTEDCEDCEIEDDLDVDPDDDEEDY